MNDKNWPLGANGYMHYKYNNMEHISTVRIMQRILGLEFLIECKNLQIEDCMGIKASQGTKFEV